MCSSPQSDRGWLSLAQSLALEGTKNKQREGPSRSPPELVPPGQARGTLAGSFALMLHLFWDKTGCEYQVRATWCYYNLLENINRIKSCRDPHRLGCRSTRDVIPVVNAATWSRGPAPALGTEGCSAAVSSVLQLLTPRGKFGHWETGDSQSPSGCYWRTNPQTEYIGFLTATYPSLRKSLSVTARETSFKKQITARHIYDLQKNSAVKNNCLYQNSTGENLYFSSHEEKNYRAIHSRNSALQSTVK